MDTKQRTGLWEQCPLDDLSSWVVRIKEKGAVQILKEPQAGLIMMRAKDSAAAEVFNLGEVLVSDCTVKVDGQLGYGIVLGNQLRRAEAAAILDAVFRAPGEEWAELRAALQPWLEEQARRRQKEQHLEFERIARSKVDFETMATGREDNDNE